MSPCESTQAHACDGTGGTTPPRVHALMPVAKNLVGFQGGIYALNTMQSHTEAATLQSPTSRPKCTNNFEVCTSRNGDGQGGLPCCGQNLPGDSRVQCIRENENFDRCVPGGCQLTDRLSDWDCNQGKQWPRPPGPPYAPPPPTPPPLPPKHPPPDSPPRVSSIRVASLSNTWQGTSGLEATELLPAAASLDAYLATSSSTISALQATELDAAQPQSPAVLAAAGSFVAALVLLYIGAWAKRRWAERPLIRPRHQRLDVSEEEFLKRDAANAEDVDQGQSPGGDGGGRAGAEDSVLPWRGLVLGSTSAAKDATAGAEETHLSSADLESPRRLDTPDVGMPDSPTCDHLDRVSLGTIPPSGVVVDPAAKARAAEAAAAAAALLSQQQQPKPQLLPPPPKAPPPGEQQPSRREAAKREAAERTAQVKQRTAQMKERNAALKLQLAEGGKARESSAEQQKRAEAAMAKLQQRVESKLKDQQIARLESEIALAQLVKQADWPPASGRLAAVPPPHGAAPPAPPPAALPDGRTPVGAATTRARAFAPCNSSGTVVLGADAMPPPAAPYFSIRR